MLKGINAFIMLLIITFHTKNQGLTKNELRINWYLSVKKLNGNLIIRLKRFKKALIQKTLSASIGLGPFLVCIFMPFL